MLLSTLTPPSKVFWKIGSAPLLASQEENEWPREDHTNPFAQPERTGIAFPDSCEPCLPSLADKPPAGAGWLHEIKHDTQSTLNCCLDFLPSTGLIYMKLKTAIAARARPPELERSPLSRSRE